MIAKTQALRLLAAATALTAFAAPQAGLAQQEAAAAASADADTGEIVVTARRREESLIDVPISVTAISGDSLARTGAVDITSLQDKTPNMTLQIARGSNSTLIAFIRGIGQQDPVWGFEPGVGLYVDDVYIARPQGAVLDIFDIDRVEVLRGPQGTLYGRNTIGGAIKYVTRRLGHEFEGKFRASYGSYNQRDFIGSVTVPLGEMVSVGGALAYYKRDGYGKNRFTGAEHYNKDVLAGRLSAEFTPNDQLSIRIAGDYTRDNSNPRHGYRLLPNGAAADFLPLGDVYDTRAGVGDDNKVTTKGVSGTIEYALNDTLTLKSITAYRKGKTDTVIDFDGTPGPVLDIPSFYKDHQLTQEFQALLETDMVQGVFGLYYLNGSASGAFDTVIGNAGLTTLTSGDVDTKSYAAFADVSVKLSERFSVSLGGRYTSDKREGTVYRADYLGLRSPLFGRPTAVPFRVRTDYTNSRTDKKFTPRISASFKPNEDVNLYASWSRGYKSGGFDPRGDAIFTPGTVNGYKPETVTAYEAGMKGAFLDRTLFVNVAGFYSRYRDQQVTTQFVSGTTVVSSVDNVGKSRIYGWELEARAVPDRNFQVQASIGYTDAKFQQFLTLDPVTLTIKDFADQRVFQNTPKYTANVSATLGHDVDGIGRFTFTPALSFRSGYSLFEVPNPVLDQKAYQLVDASIVWTSEDKRFSISGHGRNLFDRKYRVGGYNFPGALTGNSIIGFYGPPRTFTITGEVRF
ncbi:TonB-dependent receptor [Rhizorhabdus dicambivorans]|uniref:TonB-dependent receptor n=1 Tax=Rhizorhabdus dicambivorans TaxID=1850238 RepID=A0A2A4FVE5_9SPHN|nr:TonB-dependent receptor [Rhizorhabdus dicambivorans]ATE67544.1 TonB-dependent receptor [Rhizorhabdus dicambivorans]PCE42169.1 TonB-dependent receptor [Rhizorhabdus dicambivorans]